MRKLRFEYSMELKFSSPVSSHYFALRCVPGDSLRQKIELEKCRVTPADYTGAAEDGFGNLSSADAAGCLMIHFPIMWRERHGQRGWEYGNAPSIPCTGIRPRIPGLILRWCGFPKRSGTSAGRNPRRRSWKRRSAPCTIFMCILNICRE